MSFIIIVAVFYCRRRCIFPFFFLCICTRIEGACSLRKCYSTIADNMANNVQRQWHSMTVLGQLNTIPPNIDDIHGADGYDMKGL